ncbi:TPA: RNA polymerase subunit sigma [Clostridioides difficile]|nr:RNA polymerase subunit sigma [Clostridioides difficile]
MDKTTFTNNILESEQTLYRVSKSILGNDQDCEDAVNNAILKAYEKIDEKDDYSDLYTAIQSLPKKIKIPIVLYYIEGYSVDEVKEILDIPQGTVKSRLSRGRRLLKTKLENTEVII